MKQKFILTLHCPSAAGQVAAVALFLDQRQCYVEEISVFDSHDKSRFFLRCVFHPQDEANFLLTELRHDFDVVATRFDMAWAIHDASDRPRIMIMVSRYDHCLNDLLYRWRIGELPIDIAAVVSNHSDLGSVVEAHGLPFHHLPITAETKISQEEKLRALIDGSHSEVIVLARYMQILSAQLCAELHGRVINIHHSFLPGFKGARPYKQAYERGVKIIGATAHYVTTDLDEGPIIEQAVTHVDHTADIDQLQSIGRDMECQALSRALKLHVERRVFIDGYKTVVLR
ncbi:MAG: formyltetrahydrofolate deformylase [Rhodoferax sp.]|nr:formyltetrahydrofolate deformylase [Rhodoferax sp.]MBP7491665.1 formyltetrahydrofolate deformylase [Rhodoferax sp.]